MKQWKVMDNGRSPRWVAYATSPDGKRIQKVTKYKISEFSREQVIKFLEKPRSVVPVYTVSWLASWIAERLTAERRTHSTIRLYHTALEHLRAACGDDCDIRKITKQHVLKIRNHIADGIRPASVNIYMTRIAAAFGRLVEDELLTVNPFAKFQKLKEPKDRQRSMSKEQVKELLKVLDSPGRAEGKMLTKVLIYTGIRRQEVLRLRRTDVDLVKNRFRVLDVKDSEHDRWLPMPHMAIPLFKYFLETYPAKEYPFAVYKPESFSHLVKAFMREAKLPEDYHLHCARHTYATLLLEQGVPIRVVQRLLGHRRIETTLKYSHETNYPENIELTI